MILLQERAWEVDRMAFRNDRDMGHIIPPVSEGETYKVKIEDIGLEGDGIAKVEDFVIFVPETKVGQKVDVKIEKVFRRTAFGLVVTENHV